MFRYLTLVFIGMALLYISLPAKAGYSQTCQGYATGHGQFTDPNGNVIPAEYFPGIVCFVTSIPDAPIGSPGPGGDAGPGGGGAPQTSSNTAVNVLKQNSKAPPCLRVGDPIDPGTGAKVVAATDFAMPGEMGLKFERYYMSRNVHGNIGGGPGWTDNLDFELHSICFSTGDASCTRAAFMRPDGSQIYFTQAYAVSAGDFLTGPFTEVGGGGLATLTYNGNGTYKVVDEDAQVYTWGKDTTTGAFPSNKGILTSIKDPSGIGWAITHPSSAVTVVAHTSGRYMTLTTTGSLGGVSSLTVTDPAGNNYVYQAETQDSFSWNLLPAMLQSVNFPGPSPTSIEYGYKPFDPNSGHNYPKGLTEVDYDGVAHDLTTYDTNGNALSEGLADGTQTTSLEYSSNSTGAVVTITNPLGHVSTYQYNASGLPIAVTGQASSLCAASLSNMSYDSNGNMQSEVDNDSNSTHYAYLATGQLKQTVKAYGTALARTTDYVWDPTPGTDRLSSVTVEGWSQTSYTYNAQNRLATVSAKNLSGNGISGQVLTTIYQYSLYPNGTVNTMSVIHPSPSNSNTDLYTYDTLGNLTSFSNGLGQTTTLSNYTGLGDPRHAVGPNGNVTDATYDERGLLLTKTTYPNGTVATWNYHYDKFSQLDNESSPDGEVVHWNRNDEGVLQTITHNDKDGTSTETFVYDANGDVLSDVVTRGSVVGMSKHVSYDELGRVHQRTGNNGQSLTYAYDPNGNVQSITNAAGHTTANAYDQLNRVKTVTEFGGASQIPPATTPVLSVPASSANGAYAVTWTAVTGASAYLLQEQVNGGGWLSVQDNSATSWSTTGRSNGNYSYRVAACNAAGCGSWSIAGNITVAVAPGSAPTLTVPASNNTGTYSVSWSSVNYATSYTLQEQVNGGSWVAQYTGAGLSWGTNSRVASTYGYRVQACNANGCSGWSTVKAVTVSIPISANGQSYTSTAVIPTGNAATGNIGVDIANGTTWEIFHNLTGTNHRFGKLATGSVPAAAVKVEFTWTYSGVPNGYSDAGGAVSNGTSAPTAISSNPSSLYTTAGYSAASTEVGRTYQVRIDFFNATGANISSSTCTLTAELEGTP